MREEEEVVEEGVVMEQSTTMDLNCKKEEEK
jgi:hypothetical protein